MRPTAFVLLAFLAAGSASLRPCDAQIRVPRPRVPNPLDRARQAATDAVTPARQPTFDDRVLEITDARVAALIRGLRVEQTQRPVLEAGYKKDAVDRAAAEVAMRRPAEQMSAAQRCLMNSPEYRAIYGDTIAQKRAAERLEAARDRGDDRTVQHIQDSMMTAMANIDPNLIIGLGAVQERCGMGKAISAAAATPPAASRPKPPLPRLPDSLRVLGVGASGLTHDQYSMLRERVLAYLTTDEADLRNSMYVFGTNELTVLKARKRDLERYQTALVEE